ncbi:hypothetical protein CDL12_06755 [Handroanthus impetiginosus]|uniref:Uncharacterized protein n=1 Tax=Handroanthus impetiginosus TaxID=429701 RepID=A0A2G9HSQ8_9LAMI|nr:hypothetical protein CDL12_06755 [Handroanthus impetiginosus]
MISIRSPLMANALHSANGNRSVLAPRQEIVFQESNAYDAILENKSRMGVPEFQEIAKKREERQVQFSDKCALKFQVIDDTAVIEPSLNGNGKFNKNRQERKKEKNYQRNVGKASKKKETLEEGTQARASIDKKGKKILAYAKMELEALRFENLKDQRKKWAEVYCGLGALVEQEYEGLVNSANIHLKHSVPSFNFDPRPRFQKSTNLDAVAAMQKENDPKIFVH